MFICVNPWLKIFRAGGIRTHDLLNPIQAFYQAELRPESVEEHCLFVKNRENQLTEFSGTTCRRGDRSSKFATANPSYDGLNYGPIEAPNMRKLRSLATDER